jgi:uncharacterized Ntn-hydrolase superfamily protein
MTFSIVAHCASSNQFGVAISSSSPAVAARCSHARAGVGAVATQNVTTPALGPVALERLAIGDDARSAVAAAVATDAHADYRQLLAVDGRGGTAVYSGTRTLGAWNAASGSHCAAGGNLLSHEGVPAAMVAAFESATSALGGRLMAALRAGLDAGGEAGPVHSAGLLVVDAQPWPFVELRIDWLDADCPIAALERAWSVYAPQAQDYVTRALDPTAAPSYGVPGDR